MGTLLAFSGYLLIPILIAFLFRSFKIKRVYLTYIICAGIIYFYPQTISALYQWVGPHKISPAKESFRCGTGAALMLLMNIFVLIPATLLVQALFNYLFTHSFFYRKSYHEKINT